MEVSLEPSSDWHEVLSLKQDLRNLLNLADFAQVSGNRVLGIELIETVYRRLDGA